MPMEGAARGLIDSHESSSTYNFYDTELTLGLPGEGRAPPSGTKIYKNNEIEAPSATVQAIGWPPVRSFRRKAMEKCKFVKVGADGTPYLRKVDLDMYNDYQDLLKALEDMFACYIHCEGDKVMESARGMEYVPTYEDKDGDCMLVGDVPWKSFTESCKRINLMKNSQRVGLAPRCTY